MNMPCFARLCATRAGLAIAAALVTLAADAGYTPVQWIKGGGTSQTPWINTLFRPDCYDRLIAKVNFPSVSGTQTIWCSRGTSTTKDTFTGFSLAGKLRVDHGQTTGSSSSTAFVADTDYTITADGKTRTASFTDGTTTVKTSITDVAFTAGSCISLFASHTAGTNLNSQTTVSNIGSFKLYSFKIYDGVSGELLRDFVPVIDASATVTGRKVGLFDKITRTFYPNSGTGEFTAGDPTGEADLTEEQPSEQYVIDIPSGADRSITAEDVAAAAGKTLVKTGTGSLYVSGELMKDFAGDIRIRDGFYVAQSKYALGTAAGQTYVESGATLINEVSVSATDGSKPAFKDETIHLAGIGCGGWGAIQNKKSCVDFCRHVVLDGDTRIRNNYRFDLRYSTFDMNGHDLETYGEFLLVAVTYRREGNYTVRSGAFEYQSGTTCAVPVSHTFCSGSTLRLWGCSSWIGGTFLFEPNTTFYTDTGKFNLAGTDNRNILSGPVTLQGRTKLSIVNDTQIQLRSKVTGDGGIYGTVQGYLQLLAWNDFKGGIDLTGKLQGDGRPKGGVIAYADGALPNGETAAPCCFSNACSCSAASTPTRCLRSPSPAPPPSPTKAASSPAPPSTSPKPPMAKHASTVRSASPATSKSPPARSTSNQSTTPFPA